MEVAEEELTEFFSTMLPLLDERQRRVLAGAGAKMLGRGGVSAVARCAAMSRNTVITGTKEVISEKTAPSPRVRREGGGRKRLIDNDPDLLLELDDLVRPRLGVTRCRRCAGPPSPPTTWPTHLSPRGSTISPRTVGELLGEMGYSLQGTSKQKEGAQHVDRDAQFHYINETAGEFMRDDQPVISVDAKKKELVGEYSNAGKEYQPKGKPTRTKVHDFIDPEMGKAIPYGVYDLGARRGVGVGRRRRRHRRVRRRHHRALVGPDGSAPLPRRHPPAHLRGRRRVERLPDPGLEGRARQARHRDRPRDHRRATTRQGPRSGTRSSTGSSASSR